VSGRPWQRRRSAASAADLVSTPAAETFDPAAGCVTDETALRWRRAIDDPRLPDAAGPTFRRPRRPRGRSIFKPRRGAVNAGTHHGCRRHAVGCEIGVSPVLPKLAQTYLQNILASSIFRPKWNPLLP